VPKCKEVIKTEWKERFSHSKPRHKTEASWVEVISTPRETATTTYWVGGATTGLKVVTNRKNIAPAGNKPAIQPVDSPLVISVKQMDIW